jgi:hypothetical protein
MSRIRGAIVAPALLALIAPAALAQVKLERKWPENTTRLSESTVKLDQIMTIMGMEIPTQTENVVTVRREIGKRRDDGSLPITDTIESLKATIDLPGGLGVSFDSENPDAAKADPPLDMLADVFKALAGSSYTTLIKDGKAVGVEGTDKALDKANQLNPQAAEALRARLKPETIQKEFDQELKQLPDTLVRPGETWTRTDVQNIGGGQTLTYEKTYKYDGTVEKDGKTLDKISVKANSVRYAQAADDPNTAQAKVEKSDLKVSESEGTILFDREAGLVVESHKRDRLTGTITLSVMGQSLDADLELTIEESTKPKDTK